MPRTYDTDAAPLDLDDSPVVFDDDDGNELGDDAEDSEHRVAHRPNPLPGREEDEEDLAEADMLDELDLPDGQPGDLTDADDA